MSKRNYIGFAKMGAQFGPAEGRGEYTPKLPAGHYKVNYDEYNDELMLHKFVPKLDEVLNLGGKEFNDVINITKKFLSPEAAEQFQKDGFLLKRSFLFHGVPGTGKSVLSTKVSDIAVEYKNAIVLYPNDYDALERVLEVLDDTDKERFKVVSLEEFDDLVSGRDEASWTTLLDGQFQSANRLLVATTNNINSIPQRLLRPGRFNSVIEIPTLSTESRDKYFEMKGISAKDRTQVVELTKGFTVDDLKAVFQDVFILKEDVERTIDGIKAAKKLGKVGED